MYFMILGAAERRRRWQARFPARRAIIDQSHATRVSLFKGLIEIGRD